MFLELLRQTSRMALPCLLMLFFVGFVGNVVSGTDMSSNSDHYMENDTITSVSFHFDHRTRSRRNANTLSDYSQKWSIVARIANGISLVTGLTSKNISIDDVIKELLHFGDVKVDDVIGLEKKKLDAVISQLDTFSPDDSQDVKNLEEHTLGMARVRDAYMNVEFIAPPDFFSEAERFKNDANGFSAFSEIIKAAQDTRGYFDKVKYDQKLTTALSVVDAISPIIGIADKLGKIENATNQGSANFSSTIAHLDSYKELNSKDALKSLEELLHLLAIHRSLPVQDKLHASGMGKDVESVTALISNFSNIKSGLNSIRNCVKNRFYWSLVNRQHTLGFPNGASDLKKLSKDILDPSVKQSLGTGKHFSRLSAGLEPLMAFSEKLEPVDSKLALVSDEKLLRSANKITELQKLISETPPTSSGVVSVVNLFFGNSFAKYEVSQTAVVVEIIEKAGKLRTEFAKIRSSLKSFPKAPQEMAGLKTFMEKISQTSKGPEVESFLAELKTKKTEVDKVLAYLDEVRSIPNITAQQTLAAEIVGAKVRLEGLLNDVKTNAVSKLKIIKSATEPVDAVANAIRAKRLMAELKGADVSNLKLMIDTITGISDAVKSLKSSQDFAKKEQTKDVQDLIAVKDSQKTSDTIGAVADIIYNMDRLQGMESTVAELETAKDDVFVAENEKMTDPTKKKEIQTTWGDHSGFLSSLRTSYKQIESFKSTLKVVKDLRKLGDAVESAKSVGDVNGRPLEKSEAVAMLIPESSDPNNKRILEQIKANLDKLAALDLQFASRLSAVSQVPSSLTTLFDFLDKLLSVPSAGAGGGGAGGHGATGGILVITEAMGILMYVVIAIAALFFCSLAVGVGVFWYRRYTRDKKKSWREIKKWIERNYFDTPLAAEAFGRSLYSEMIKEVRSDLKFKPVEKSKMRYPQAKLLLETAVNLPDGRFIDANWIKAQSGCKFIATQGPLDGTKGGTVDTRVDLLYMAMEYEVEFIVQLCNFMEDCEDVYDVGGRRKPKVREKEEISEVDQEKKGPRKPVSKEREQAENMVADIVELHKKEMAKIIEKAARYYEHDAGDTMTIKGKYSVCTNSLSFSHEETVQTRQLTITNLETKKEHKLTHITHVAWDDCDVPNDGVTVIDIMEKVNKSRNPIIVHCSSGIGRTVTFIAAEVIARDIERHPKKRATEMFVPLRMSRFQGFQSATQAYYAVVCAIGLLINEYSPKDKELFTKHYAMFYPVSSIMNDGDEEHLQEQVANKRITGKVAIRMH